MGCCALIVKYVARYVAWYVWLLYCLLSPVMSPAIPAIMSAITPAIMSTVMTAVLTAVMTIEFNTILVRNVITVCVKYSISVTNRRSDDINRLHVTFKHGPTWESTLLILLRRVVRRRRSVRHSLVAQHRHPVVRRLHLSRDALRLVRRLDFPLLLRGPPALSLQQHRRQIRSPALR